MSKHLATLLISVSSLFYVAFNCAAITAAAQPTNSIFRSADLGVSHCALQGDIGGQVTDVHLWLRAHVFKSPESSRRGLWIKGFAFLYSALETFKGPQLNNALKARERFTNEIEIRAFNSNLSLVLNKGVAKAKNDVTPLTAEADIEDILIKSPPSALGIFEMEVAVIGFETVCQFLVPLDIGSNKEAGPPIRGVGTSGTSTSLGRKGQTTVLLSPFFESDVSIFATLLGWHMTWHREFGVELYVLYVINKLNVLLESPLIQTMLNEGKLKIVLWQDLPTASSGRAYAHQVLIYNHGILALHEDESLVLVVDLDEYLLTPSPMTVKEVMVSCEAGAIDSRGEKTGTLIVGRYDALDTSSTAAEGGIELLSWMLPKPVMEMPSIEFHPLRQYTSYIVKDLKDKKKQGSYIDNKPIHQPKFSLAVTVHGGYAAPDAKVLKVEDGKCAKWLHIVNLRKPRRSQDSSMQNIDPHWMWPFHKSRKENV